MTEEHKDGDCFVVAAEIVAQFDMPLSCGQQNAREAITLLRLMDVQHHDLVLVHGQVTRVNDGLKHTHAWVEYGITSKDVVVDFSNGHHHLIPAVVYYSVGKIEDTTKYDSNTTKQMMLKHGSYGPWEDDDE